MKPAAVIFMILILGLIWGGLVFFISYAFHREKKGRAKVENGE